MSDVSTEFQPRVVNMPGEKAKALLTDLSDWGKLTTIVFAGGSVFEFKGAFPKGSEAQGYYNLDSGGEGFEGHLNLAKVDTIQIESKLHRGRPAYCFVLVDADNNTLFKIFLGRDSKGAIIADQLKAFEALQAQYQ